MAIIAKNSGTQRELIPAGTYVSRCYSMIEIGTVREEYMGEPKSSYKVRLSWELPTEKRVFKPENGEQPMTISKTYTLSMHEKANLRKDLESWRGKAFTEEEAKAFDITVLLGKPCMLNIIHKPNKDGSKIREQIAGITTVLKGYDMPPAINQTIRLEFDNWSQAVFDSLPDFIQNDIKSTPEYAAMKEPQNTNIQPDHIPDNEDNDDGLPF
jgi:hypothetical protein